MPQRFFPGGGEPFEQRNVDLRASPEVVMHQAARDTGRTCDVLDRDLLVAPFDEQVVGRVEHLLTPLRGVQAAALRSSAHRHNVPYWRFVRTLLAFRL